MDIFDKLVEQLLIEFNVQDRNDPAFYDYAVIFVQQLKARNLVPPEVDVKRTARNIVRNGYYNYIDPQNNVSLKVLFLFDTTTPSPNTLKVKIDDLINKTPSKNIENTHEEQSVGEIVDHIEKVSQETKQKASIVPGQDVPAEVSQTPSKLPNAEPAQQPNTSQYLKGL